MIWALALSYPLIASISSATKSFNIVWTSNLAASGSTGSSSAFLSSSKFSLISSVRLAFLSIDKTILICLSLLG